MNIHTLDLNFQGIPNLIAAYLIQGPAGYALVETGPMTTLPTLLDNLANYGLTPADIRHVLVTHIHLDHAGAAGWWARQGAQVYVHSIGQPHLIDPSRLLQSVQRIYGDMMESLWGEVLPAPADCVTPVEDGMSIEVAGLTLRAMNTPGHAWHHHTYRLGEIAFCGDAAGVCLNNSPWVSFPSPPPEYNLEAWRQTLDRLEAAKLEALYLTHFGRVEHVQEHLERVRHLMEEMSEFVRVHMDTGMGRNQLVREYIDHVAAAAEAQGLTEEGWRQYESVIPTFMSVDGIIRYWQRQKQI
jgi:glyoxylase-like metal-dependent hydrolase (beta-lactamase superfamily II)